MKRSVSVVAMGATALLTLTVATALPAEAGTPSWLRVKTVSKTKAYNGGRATVVPKASARGHRVITSLRITAFKGNKRVGSGKKVKLKPGTYRTITSGTSRTYKYVTVNRTRRVLHEGDYRSATCKVTSSTPDEFGLGESTATCRNGYYPKQHPTDTQYENYAVGHTYTESVFFDNEYVTQKYKAKVRKYGKNTKFSSKKRKLVVRDGGFRKQFRGSHDTDTKNFRVPKKSWRVSYSYDCDDYSNYSIVLHKANGEYVDLVANELGTYGSGSARENGKGKYYLEIESTANCSWTVTVR